MTVLASPPMTQGTPLLLPTGPEAFERIVARINGARHDILIRAFTWRDDETGELVAQALVRAADRGVHVRILKDRMSANYEYLEGSYQSFFHKTMTLAERFQCVFLMLSYNSWTGFGQRRSELSEELLSHENIEVEVNKRYDHAKVFLFDDDVMILGGMGVGNDSLRNHVDMMVEVSGTAPVRRFIDRQERCAEFDSSRQLDFLLYAHEECPQKRASLANHRLTLINEAQQRLTIEMAYLGDPRFTRALIDAVKRGVHVSLMTSEMSNILGNLNRGTCDEILRETGAPDNLKIFLHPRMVHSKVMIIDRKIVTIGSANFTQISNGVYQEVDLFYRDAEFAEQLESLFSEHTRDCAEAGERVPYSWIYWLVEGAIVAHQAEAAARLSSRPDQPARAALRP